MRIIISDEERHEVAKNLRKEFNNDFDGVNPRIVRLPKFSGFLELNYSAAMNLANLIDRPICNMIYDGVHDDFECTNCGEIFELIDYNVSRSKVVKEFAYCPHCGAKVIDND